MLATPCLHHRCKANNVVFRILLGVSVLISHHIFCEQLDGKTSFQKTNLSAQSKSHLWLEGEAAEPERGMEVDTRKSTIVSGTKCLGIHADAVDLPECRWSFSLSDSIFPTDCRFALRYATVDSVELEIELDGKSVGIIFLPQSSGWGYSSSDWNWGIVELNTHLMSGAHTLTLTTRSSNGWNLDCAGIFPSGVSLDPDTKQVRLEKLTPDPPIKLPVWQPTGGRELCSVSLGGKETVQRIWGRGQAKRFYPNEMLPAIFRRTLVLEDPLPAEFVLEWKFTGPRGGIDLTLSQEKVNLRTRFYDSPGYNEFTGRRGRHPEWSEEKDVPFEGALQSAYVEVDREMNLALSLNGKIILEDKWHLDLTRHQLWLRKGDKITCRLFAPKTLQESVRLKPKQVHQEMIGFGGITIPTAYALLSQEGKRQWWRLLTDYNLLIQREYPIGSKLNEDMTNWNTLDDATPHYYSSNFPNGEICDFDYNKIIYDLGGIVWFEFWALPPWVGDDVEKYAMAMVNYCETSSRKSGYAPQVVGIQNEHSHPTEHLHTMVKTLRRRLDEAGFQETRIHSSNLSTMRSGTKEMAKYKQDKIVWEMVDYAATNMYDFQEHFYAIDEFDEILRSWHEVTASKPFLAVEICINRPQFQLPSYRTALVMGELYHKVLTIADASAMAYCWTLLNIIEPSFGWTRSLCVVDESNGFVPVSTAHQLRVFGAYSRRIKRGMMRIDAVSDNPNLLLSAFRGTDGEMTLIALNRGIHPIEMRLDQPTKSFTESERVSMYLRNKVEPYEKHPVYIAPGEIVTLTNMKLNVLPESFLADHGIQ